LQTIKEIRDLFLRDRPPEGIEEWSRCKHCSMVDYCLPQERAKLKGKVPWERFI
jgi:CRISPR-associated exonuclease Cas4